MVETIFVGMIATKGAAVIARLVDTVVAPDILAMADAQRWAEEWSLFTWSERQNMERGVAPSTAALLCELAKTRAASGGPPPGAITQGKVRQWGTEFRRRWGGCYGALPAKDCVPLCEMQAKVVARPRWR